LQSIQDMTRSQAQIWVADENESVRARRFADTGVIWQSPSGRLPVPSAGRQPWSQRKTMIVRILPGTRAAELVAKRGDVDCPSAGYAGRLDRRGTAGSDGPESSGGRATPRKDTVPDPQESRHCELVNLGATKDHNKISSSKRSPMTGSASASAARIPRQSQDRRRPAAEAGTTGGDPAQAGQRPSSRSSCCSPRGRSTSGGSARR